MPPESVKKDHPEERKTPATATADEAEQKSTKLNPPQNGRRVSEAEALARHKERYKEIIKKRNELNTRNATQYEKHREIKETLSRLESEGTLRITRMGVTRKG
jgi:hypothetical protein